MGASMYNLAAMAMLLALPLAIASPSIARPPPPAPSNIYDLIIIGSGMAGLGAAKRARELGVARVLILEARNRIGGRTVTQNLDITPPPNSPSPAAIDLGAAWIHGSTSASRGLNPMSKLANDAGTGYVTVTGNDISFSPQGTEDTDQWYNTYENMLGRWEDFYDNYLNGDISGFSPQTSHSMETVYNRFLQSASWSSLQRTTIAQALMTEIVMDYAADLNQLSGRWSQDDLIWGSGPDALPTRGYGALVSYLSTNLTIWTNYAVDIIDYSNPSTVNVSGRILSGAGGRFSLRAKGVINTMPLGYLQAQLAPSTPTLFRPQLSSSQATAIKAMGMGLLNKVILVWSDSSWYSDVITAPWVTVRNTSNPGSFSEYYNLAATQTRLPIIICFNGGSFAKNVESLSDETTVRLALQPLQRLFPRDGFQQPVQTIVTRWASDPWTYGSYSYNRVGVVGGTRAQAFAPLGSQKRVGFAGEHTHSQFPATAHGAYLSGVAEAQRLAPLVK